MKIEVGVQFRGVFWCNILWGVPVIKKGLCTTEDQLALEAKKITMARLNASLAEAFVKDQFSKTSFVFFAAFFFALMRINLPMFY